MMPFVSLTTPNILWPSPHGGWGGHKICSNSFSLFLLPKNGKDWLFYLQTSNNIMGPIRARSTKCARVVLAIAFGTRVKLVMCSNIL